MMQPIIPIELYETALVVAAVFMAGLFTIATILLYSLSIRKNGRLVGSFLWSLHAAIFFTVSAFVRYFFHVDSPHFWLTMWSLIVYFHAGLSLIAMAMAIKNSAKGEP